MDAHFREDFDPSEFRASKTANLLERAYLCASCHVGDAQRQVDHDLIAAGHPALKFEMASYSELLPKHWSDQRERDQIPELELRLWLSGQLAATDMALQQLETRLSVTEDERHAFIWPEFSEVDCFRCHQDVRGSGWKGGRESPWGTWYFWMADLKTDPESTNQAFAEFVGAARELRQSMGQLWRAPRMQADLKTRAQRVTLRETLKGLRDVTAPWLSVRAGDDRRDELPQEARQMIAAARFDDSQSSWDAAAQRYLALAALAATDRDQEEAKSTDTKAELGGMRELLAFPRDSEGPAWGPGSSGSERRDAFRILLEKSREASSAPSGRK